MSQRIASTTPPTLGAVAQADWEQAQVTLEQGSSVVELLRARGIPATRDLLAAIAQVNGITDFRRMPAGTLLWIPRRESVTGERAAVWREAYRTVGSDSFAVVDRDRAAGRSVRGRETQRPSIAEPRTPGPRPAGDVIDPATLALPPAASQQTAPQSALDVPAAAPQSALDVPAAAPQSALDVPATAPQSALDVPAAAPQAPAESASTIPADPRAALSSEAAAAIAVGPSPSAPQRLQSTVQALVGQLRGARDRDTVLRLVYDLMSNPDWTNAAARAAYAQAAGAPGNEWKLITDLRASGLSSRDILRASEYVWNDESTPFDGDVSPAIRAVLAAVGYRERGFGQLDAAFGTASQSLEEALWGVVDTMGVDAANAYIATRAGENPAGIVSNLRFNHDEQNPGLLGRAADLFFPGRRPAPVNGAPAAAPAGANPLADIIRTEKGSWNPLASNVERDRLLAILRMPPGVDRRAFDTAFRATRLEGEDFLKLFEGRTREEMAEIENVFALGFGADNGGSLSARALRALDTAGYARFHELTQGSRTDPEAAARYIALTLRARHSDNDAMRDVLTRLLGNTESGTPCWSDVLAADRALSPARAAATPLTTVIGALATDPLMRVITRDNANPNEPAGLASRILYSRDPREITRLLRRTDGELFNDQELAIMHQVASQIANRDINAVPGAFYEHVLAVCGPGSEAEMIARRAGGPAIEAPMYDELGRLSPAAQLFFALQSRNADAVSRLLSRTTFVDLGRLEADYPQIVRFYQQQGGQAPGNTTSARDAIRATLRGEERTRALQFMTGLNVTSAEATNQTGAQLAAEITRDLESRCAWLLRMFDHEREPLRERLMQFEVTLGQVLTAVQERRQSSGQVTELTYAEQVRLGEAVRQLTGQRQAFSTERDGLAKNIQDTTILVSTTVASIALTVGTAGLGAPAGAALMATATNIARVAAVGAVAGLATAPLQGGDNRYLIGAAKGTAYGAFAGLGASMGSANAALSRIMPGTGLAMNTARNAVVMGTAWGGLSASGNIGVEFESTGAAVRKVGGDALQGMAFGAGVAGLLGLSAWLARYAATGQVSGEVAAPAGQQPATAAARGAADAQAPRNATQGRTQPAQAQPRQSAPAQRSVQPRQSAPAQGSVQSRQATGRSAPAVATPRGAPVAPQASPTQLAQNLSRYANARDLTSMQRAFARLAGDALPPAGQSIALDATTKALLRDGITRHMAALAAAPATTAAQIGEQARWLATLTLYAEAGGITLQGASIEHAIRLLQRIGVQNIPARLTEAQARALLLRTAGQLRDGTLVLSPPGIVMPRTSGSPAASSATAASSRGVRLSHTRGRAAVELRSWNAVSNHARTAGTRAQSLQSALHSREELATMRRMLDTPTGRASTASLKGELGQVTNQQLGQIRRSYTAALGRVDHQIATSIRTEAATLARTPVAQGDPTAFYERLSRLGELDRTMAVLRDRGMTRELFEATTHNVSQARATIDAGLAARVRQTFANVGSNPRAMLQNVQQYRSFLQSAGYAESAPATMRAVNDAVRRLQAAARRAAA